MHKICCCIRIGYKRCQVQLGGRREFHLQIRSVRQAVLHRFYWHGSSYYVWGHISFRCKPLTKLLSTGRIVRGSDVGPSSCESKAVEEYQPYIGSPSNRIAPRSQPQRTRSLLLVWTMFTINCYGRTSFVQSSLWFMRRTTRCLLARPADKQVSKRRQPMNSTCAISHWTNLFESQHSVVIEPSRQYNIEERYVRLKNHGNVPISSKKTRENAGTGT